MDDFAALQTSVQQNLVATTRDVSRLAAEDLQFHRSIDSSIGTQLDAQNARLLDFTQRLLGSATTNTQVVRPSLKDIDDVEGNWNKVVDVIDSLLERADTALDEFTGAVKRLTPRETTPAAKTGSYSHLASAFRNQNIDKPQLLFDRRTDNYPQTPFKPLLTSKPHSSIPVQSEPSILEETGALGFEHPYKREIEHYEYPATIYTQVEPIMYDPFDQTEATLVDSEEALNAMIAELKTADVIAVDLEHHDQRSYIGIVSLMQISTRDHDWVVDTLKPWRHKLSRLNEVFTDSSIIKVLHGAYMDIMWLQRDLGLYVVSLFDTFAAARSLGYPQASYAYLLKRFTNVDAQKQYQMADWRIRPLPQELLDYARSDTHYLLYIFDNMRNELIDKSDLSVPNHEKDKIHDVLEQSKETSLQRYEHHIYDFETGQGSGGWFKMLIRTPVSYNKEQFAVYKAVHQWRDQIARSQDDNTSFIMPNHTVFTVARTLPTTKSELLNAAQPVSQTVKLHIDELLSVIIAAKENSEDGPEMMDVLNQYDPLGAKKFISRAANESFAPKVQGVAGFLRRTIAEPLVSTLPLRSMKSLFWGSSLDHKGQQKKHHSTAVHIAVPLPPMTSGVFTENMASTLTEAENPQVSTPVIPRPEQDDEVFVLKELTKKRKLAQTKDDDEDGMKHQADEVALPDEDEERARHKAEKKRAKREAKLAARAAMQDDASSNEHAEESFDYASAPSVLHQPLLDKKSKRREKKKSFDPYSKSMNTPKGLPRVQKESAGRSMTYAS